MPADIPSGWRRVHLGDVLAGIPGGGTPTRETPAFWGGSIPWATVKDMGRSVLASTEETITPAGVAASSTRVIPAGTVLLATRMAVGAIAWTSCDAAINQDLKALIPSSSLDARFLFQFMLSQRRKFEAAGTGTTVKGVSVDFVRALDLLLPPLEEQRAIAAVLDAVDDTIERTEAVIAATEELRRGLLHELLTLGVPGWHSEWKRAPGLGTVPACWEVVRLGDVLKTATYGTNVSLDGAGAVPVLRMNNIQDGELDLSDVRRADLDDREVQKLDLLRGDILFNRTNSLDLVGKVAIVRDLPQPASFASYLVRLRVRPELVDPFWLSAMLASPDYQARIQRFATPGVSQANINPTSLKSLTILLPSIEEQREAIRALEALRARSVAERAEREVLLGAKAAASDALLTGRVRVGTVVDGGP